MESVISKIESLEIGLSIEIDNFLDNEMNKWRERKEAETTRYEAARKQKLARMEEELAAAYNRHEREKAMKERAAHLEAERIACKKADEELQRKIKEDANIISNLDKTIQQQLNDYKTS
ncbi:hypothetical protein PPL_03683 [Heterostelium album PN500]|uniref:Uncharacterized protein n=1 Tax=Heterostelium pallidum (strain ATCC 26659 / Pp 5 / PN500) TaxID=670386 RepID=D3B6D5_HETP5|nr:hypothetical protein PPL_03683 [Heterostelium album PN500]EFA82905.1 hypothetical protein PPL_03683 [Heterostelium album PN500]|eukprot:XP_020435022.1 hypothetical protein PPL_03683 [Heterostelium album PN500]